MTATQTDLAAPDELELEPTLWQRALPFVLRFWIVFLLLGMIAYFAVTTPGHVFLHAYNLNSITLDASEVILLALGETFVIVTAGIDLSVGGILMVSGVCGGLVMERLSGTHAQVAALQFPHATRGVPIGLAVALLVGTGCGAVNGLLITRLRLPSFIVTLGTLGMTFGAADLLTGGTNITSVPAGLQNSIGNGRTPGIHLYYAFVTALGFVVLSALLLNQTRFGRYTQAFGSNAEGTRRAGIRVDRHLVKVYAFSGFLASIAGIIDLSRFGTLNLAAHNTDNLNAIAAVVIGGTSLFGGYGTILGTVIGAFIPGVLTNGLTINGIDPFWQEVLVGAVIILAVYLDQLRRRRWSG